MSLEKLSIRDSFLTTDQKNKVSIFHVKDPHALIQAAGYLKYINGKRNEPEQIYFRGNTKLYDKLEPTLYRGCKTQAAQQRRTNAITATIAEIQNELNIFNSFYEESHEPLLQHYGLKTSWVDIVDNIWIALWFGCNKAKQIGSYIHYERRTPKSNSDEYVYISLVATDCGCVDKTKPGLYYGKQTELIDLRIATPSVFLRPHAQHGLLFRRRGSQNTQRPTDYFSQIRGIVRIDLADALSWLGDGKTLSVHSLFPPMYYDHGYRILMSATCKMGNAVGCFSNIGA